jgi:hypothetical protein
LEPGQLWVIRIHAAIAGLALLLLGAAAETVLRERFGIPRGAVLLPLLLPLAWIVFIAPGRRYRAWGYVFAPEELSVRRGIWTELLTLVPLERVQHIDISQGPVERAFGVCRLVLHTAGTLHSRIVLPGLSRETAERMRDEIRARISAEAA